MDVAAVLFSWTRWLVKIIMLWAGHQKSVFMATRRAFGLNANRWVDTKRFMKRFGDLIKIRSVLQIRIFWRTVAVIWPQVHALKIIQLRGDHNVTRKWVVIITNSTVILWIIRWDKPLLKIMMLLNVLLEIRQMILAVKCTASRNVLMDTHFLHGAKSVLQFRLGIFISFIVQSRITFILITKTEISKYL